MKTINKSTLDFLKLIKKNNNREWIQANRPAYLAAKENFESFVQEIIDQLVDFDPIIKGLEAKNCIYRINRDIRFSNDKSPYKTNFGAFIVKGGRKNGNKYAGYYVHTEPGKSFIAGGAYMPPTQWLSSIRERIDEEPSRFLEIINDKDFKDIFGKVTGESLKKAPKGYPSDHPMIEYLKFKSYLVVNDVKDDLLLSDKYPAYVIKVLRTMKSFNDFLNEN
jgi:uncharacterized protein (TIGR02453 family)